MIRSMQVTIGAAATQVTTVRTPAKQVIVQNNDADDAIRVADASADDDVGLAVAKGGGSVTFGPFPTYDLDLQNFWIAGTESNVVDVLWVE